MTSRTVPLGQREFVALVAFLTMVIAVGTDFMLTSIGTIGRDLGVTDPNAPQLIIPVYLLGLALGQLFAGPASDYLGRKPVILSGLGIFMFGSVICLFSQSFEAMLFGRLIQGIGTAGPRTVTMALVRDLYAGRAMARIMSFVMAVFIVVPALAPSLGMVVANTFGWRAIFSLYVIHAITAGLWFGLRQFETNPAQTRRVFSAQELFASLRIVITNATLVRYTIVTGCIFGAFFAYLSASPQIYDEVFNEGERFPLFFAALAVSLGGASLVNGNLVTRLGMHRLIALAIGFGCTITALYLALVIFAGFGNWLPAFVAWCLIYFFCQGIIMGNIGAIAMEPLPDQAGMAATIFSTFSTLIGITIATPLGLAFDGTVVPLTAGFLVCALIALTLILTDKRDHS